MLFSLDCDDPEDQAGWSGWFEDGFVHGWTRGYRGGLHYKDCTKSKSVCRVSPT